MFCGALLLMVLGYWKQIFRWILIFTLFLLTTWFGALTPQKVFHDRSFQPPWREMPEVIHWGADKPLTIRKIRDFSYRSENDFDVCYRDRGYSISDVQTLDLAVSHWDGLQRVAHTMLSFGFSDNSYLVLSAETRLPIGAEQGFLPGFYKQYELIDILGTETDLFRLRTEFRKEELYLYRTNATPEQVRMLLEQVLERVDSLKRHPEFYNSLTQNCTTSLAPLLRSIKTDFKWDLRLLANGKSDEMLFEFGYLAHKENESFSSLKQRSRITPGKGRPEAGYSARIRKETQD